MRRRKKPERIGAIRGQPVDSASIHGRVLGEVLTAVSTGVVLEEVAYGGHWRLGWEVSHFSKRETARSSSLQCLALVIVDWCRASQC